MASMASATNMASVQSLAYRPSRCHLAHEVVGKDYSKYRSIVSMVTLRTRLWAKTVPIARMACHSRDPNPLSQHLGSEFEVRDERAVHKRGCKCEQGGHAGSGVVWAQLCGFGPHGLGSHSSLPVPSRHGRGHHREKDPDPDPRVHREVARRSRLVARAAVIVGEGMAVWLGAGQKLESRVLPRIWGQSPHSANVARPWIMRR